MMNYDFIKKLILSWRENRITSLSAALAFYMVFSLAPLLLISITIAGFFWGSELAQSKIITQISELLGSDVALQIKLMIKSTNKPLTAGITNLIGFFVLAFGVSNLFSELQGSLNIIFGLKSKYCGGFFRTVKDRLLSFTMVIGVGFFLLISMLATTFFAVMADYLSLFLGGEFLVKLIASDVSSFLLTILSFAMIFKVLPDIDILWRDVWLGAFITALMFTLGKYILAFYLSRAQVWITFGTSGSIVAILIWIYYSAQIFFVGAEITKVFIAEK